MSHDKALYKSTDTLLYYKTPAEQHWTSDGMYKMCKDCWLIPVATVAWHHWRRMLSFLVCCHWLTGRVCIWRQINTWRRPLPTTFWVTWTLQWTNVVHQTQYNNTVINFLHFPLFLLTVMNIPLIFGKLCFINSASSKCSPNTIRKTHHNNNWQKQLNRVRILSKIKACAKHNITYHPINTMQRRWLMITDG